jgi:hypothetical protein
MTGNVQPTVPKPRLDDCRINTCSDQLNARRVTVRVGRHPLLPQRWQFSDGSLDVLLELKANAGGTEGLAIVINKHGLVVSPWLSSQQCLEQLHRFGP